MRGSIDLPPISPKLDRVIVALLMFYLLFYKVNEVF
jgi:hypothetical protein